MQRPGPVTPPWTAKGLPPSVALSAFDARAPSFARELVGNSVLLPGIRAKVTRPGYRATCASTSSLSRIRCSARARDAPERWPKTTGESIRT